MTATPNTLAAQRPFLTALGVTTAVIGNCGFGVAPCPAPMRETMMKNLSVVEGMDLNALLTGVRTSAEKDAPLNRAHRKIQELGDIDQ